MLNLLKRIKKNKAIQKDELEQEADLDAEMADDFDHDNNHDETVLSLPKQLIIGHYSNIKKKDLIDYLFNRALTNMDVNNAYYDIQKFEDGFIWSLQEGGSPLGCLSSLSKMLNDGVMNIVINIDDRQLQISRRSSQTGFSSFLINASERLAETDGVVFEDKIKPVVKHGAAFLKFSAFMFASSIAFLFISAIFKFVIYNTEQRIDLKTKEVDMPHVIGLRLMVKDDEYISEVRFKNGKWEPPVRKKADAPIEDPIVSEAQDILGSKGQPNE
jgi:hypothetical protein